MDLAPYDDRKAGDRKVLRGIDLLGQSSTDNFGGSDQAGEDARADRPASRTAAKKGALDEAGQKQIQKIASDEAGQTQVRGGHKGLGVGRRSVVVVEAPAQKTEGARSLAGKRGNDKVSSSAVRVYDHGDVQRQAVSRMFDSNVVQQVCEEEVVFKERECQILYAALQENDIELPTLTCSADDTVEDIRKSLKVKKTLTLREQMEYREADSLPRAAAEQCEVPSWMRNDTRSREKVEFLKADIMQLIQLKGDKVENREILDRLWDCGAFFSGRWAGGPDIDILAKNKELEKRFKDVQRQSLQETGMLRQHIKRMENQYKELQSNAKQLKAAVGQAKQVIQKQKVTIELLHKGAPSGLSPGGGAASPTRAFGVSAPPQQRLSTYAMPQEQLDSAQDGGRPNAPILSSQGLSPEAMEHAAGGCSKPSTPLSPAASHMSGTNRNSLCTTGDGMSFHVPASLLGFDVDQGMTTAPSFEQIREEQSKGIKLSPITADEDLGYVVTDEALVQMDNEFFEPLSSFDDEMKELMIDCINSKVRRILSLDPNNFQNGKLPFGLRPDNKSDLEEELEAEIRRLTGIIADLEQERDTAKSEVEDLRRQVEAMRMRQALQPDKPAPVQEVIAAPVKEEPKPPPTIRKKIQDASVQIEDVVHSDKYLKDKVTEAVKEAVAEATKSIKEMKAEIAKLESLVKNKDKEIEEYQRKLMEAMKPAKKEKPKTPPKDLSGEVAALQETIRDLRENLERMTVENEEYRRKSKELERALEEERNKPPKEVHIKPKTPPPQVVVPQGAPDPDTAAVKKTQSELFNLLLLLSKELSVAASEEGQKAAMAILKGDASAAFQKVKIKKGSTKAQAEQNLSNEAVASLEVWSHDVVEAATGLGKRIKDLENKPPEIVTETKIVKETIRINDTGSPREGKCYKKEHADLERKLKEMQDEISRLLLTIDEMRRRIEQLTNMPMNPEEQSTMKSIMEKVGLKEMAEGNTLSPVHLKGVFQRLYQDAIQRIQRFGMLRERVLMATTTYNTVAGTNKAEIPPDKVPDFERLIETTRATVRGMWYNVDNIFQRTCEYAMTQGVEAAHRGAAGEPDMLDSPVFDSGLGLHDEMLSCQPPRRCRPVERLPARRGERMQRLTSGQPVTTASAKDLKSIGGDTAPDFAAYMAKLRESQQGGALVKDWPKTSIKSTTGADPVSAATLDNFRSIKAACTPSNSPGLAGSRSLPALPKLRGVAQAPELAPRSPANKVV